MTTLKGQGVYFYSNVSIDKIVPNFGYIKSNVQLVCSWANTAKSNLSMEEFSKMIALTHIKLNKVELQVLTDEDLYTEEFINREAKAQIRYDYRDV